LWFVQCGVQKIKLLYLDTETTGLDPTKNAIIQISGIIEINGEVVREFDFRLRPHLDALIEQQALDANKITREELLDPARLEPIDAYKALKSIFLTYINKYDKEDKLYLVGQNVHFDYGFLLELWKRNGDMYLGSFIHYHKIDLIALTASLRVAGVFTKEKVPNLKLSTLAPLFGLGEQSHDSMSDIRQTRSIFLRILEKMKVLRAEEIFGVSPASH